MLNPDDDSGLSAANKSLSSEPLLPEAERRRLVVEWNRTRADFPRESCFHELFEAQAERTPDAVAAVFEKQKLTYRQLNERANQIARFLRRQGAGPEIKVGLYVERSLEMLLGILGTLKAGAAYVPMDPSYPAELTGFMLEDARVSLLLTQERLLARLPESHARIFRLDSDEILFVRESAKNPENLASPDNLAYVIYTSGSTGKPKGVQVSHRNLVHSTAARLAWEPQPVRSFLLLSSIAFDSSVAGLFSTLCRGATLVLPGEEAHRDPLLLARLIPELGISHTLCVPSLYKQLLEAARPGQLDSLARVVVAGESCPRDLLLAHRAALPQTDLVNEYGPTECTVWSTAHRFAAEGPANSLLIGRPIANTRIYLLDGRLRPVPTGVAGEIYVGGEGVARGYENRPERTAEKFLPDPFAGEGAEGSSPGSRLYKTGDLARYLPDGNIEFLGRIDQQIKLRGFRIEPKEVEAALSEHPSVAESVVLARADEPGDKRLVAYLVLREKQEAPPSREELRAFARQKLPEHMVPSAFVLLDEIPKTPAGKIARAALPPPDRNETGLAQPVPPRDDLERRLTEIWEALLGVSNVGTTENFFDLGGHSLLAARLFSRIEKVFGRALPVGTLFRAPTIEQLGRVLREGEKPAPSASLVPIQPRGSRPPFFYVHEVRGNIVGSHVLARHLGPDQPIYGFQAQGLDGTQAPLTRLRDMAAHYVREMRAFQPQGPYYLGGFSFGGVVAFEMACQLDAQGEKVGLMVFIDTFCPAYFKSLSGTAARIAYHGKKLFLGPARLEHLRGGLARIERRMKRRVRRVADTLYESIGEPPPRPLPSVYEANLRALKDWEPRVYAGRVTLLRSEERSVNEDFDPRLGWPRLAAGGMEIVHVPGEHATMLLEPHVRVLAERLAECLRKASGDESRPAGESRAERS